MRQRLQALLFRHNSELKQSFKLSGQQRQIVDGTIGPVNILLTLNRRLCALKQQMCQVVFVWNADEWV